MRVPERKDAKGKEAKGSLRWIRALVAQPSLIDDEIRQALGLGADVAINWRSPRADDDHAEYRDGAFLEQVGLGKYCDQLSEFWPRGGPQWDALATTSDRKVILVEAKAHASELRSTCAASAEESRTQITRALAEARKGLGARSDADWLSPYYQYANRLAHLYFLRKKCGVDAHLVFLYLVNDRDMKGPESRAVWEESIGDVHKALGLPKALEGVHDVFIDVSSIGAGTP